MLSSTYIKTKRSVDLEGQGDHLGLNESMSGPKQASLVLYQQPKIMDDIHLLLFGLLKSSPSVRSIFYKNLFSLYENLLKH